MAGSLQEQVTAIEQRLALIETRLEQLFAHLKIEPLKHPSGGREGGGWWGGSGGEEAAGGAPPSDRVIELVKEGNTIEAIKLHGEQTGLGLKEAKDAVEALTERD